jgi:enoyl-CoA hydratase
MTSTTAEATHVRTAVKGRVGVITLTRAQALNALTTQMVEVIDETLVDWTSLGLRAVVLESNNPRAFCAGGDIRAMHRHSVAGDAESCKSFFAAEYRLNARIGAYPTPVVSLIDGMCLGGGMGLSMHGQFRVVTENAKLSMPEVAIGLFPDVGGSYVLPRLPGAIGTYLGMTGAKIDAADALYTGLATHFLSREEVGSVVDAINRHDNLPVDQVLHSLAGPSPVANSALARSRADIDWCFSANTVADIDARLASLQGEWARTTRDHLRTLSPQSLHLTLDLLAWGRERRTLPECLAVELQLAAHVVRTADFIEGVRATLIDKDRQPVWSSRGFIGFDPDGTPQWNH